MVMQLVLHAAKPCPPTKQPGIQQVSHGILLLKAWMHCQMEMQSPGAGSRQGDSLGFFFLGD